MSLVLSVGWGWKWRGVWGKIGLRSIETSSILRYVVAELRRNSSQSVHDESQKSYLSVDIYSLLYSRDFPVSSKKVREFFIVDLGSEVNLFPRVGRVKGINF